MQNTKFQFWSYLLPGIVLLPSSETLPLEQEKEYDFLNRRIIDSFMKMSPFWLESKWKKKILFSLKKYLPLYNYIELYEH